MCLRNQVGKPDAYATGGDVLMHWVCVCVHTHWGGCAHALGEGGGMCSSCTRGRGGRVGMREDQRLLNVLVCKMVLGLCFATGGGGGVK